MNQDKTALIVFAYVIAVITVAVLVGNSASLNTQPATVVEAMTVQQWPGEARLWASSAVTQTVQYRGLDVTGTQYRYLFYATGVAPTTTTLTITVASRWDGNTLATDQEVVAIGEATSATGMITVTAPPYYPSLLVSVVNETDSLTVTAAMVAQ